MFSLILFLYTAVKTKIFLSIKNEVESVKLFKSRFMYQRCFYGPLAFVLDINIVITLKENPLYIIACRVSAYEIQGYS
jgi:hypothetical protein